MEIKVQITVESQAGKPEVVEVARLERGPLRPDTLGLSLAEARSILAGLEQSLVERQTRRVYRPSAALPSVRPAARVQRAPPARVSHPIWQTAVGQPAAVPLPM
jgi:hypothetical protein